MGMLRTNERTISCENAHLMVRKRRKISCGPVSNFQYAMALYMYMTDYFLNVPSQKFPVPKITKQTKSHSLNFNVLSSVIDSSGEEV